MSLKKKAISGMSWTLFQQFGTMGIGFVISVVLARLIDPEEFGILGLLVIFNAIGNSLSDSGMGQSIIRGDYLEEDDYGTIFITNLGVSVFLYLIIGLCGPLIAAFYDRPIISDIIWVYSFSIVLSAFSTIQATRLTKHLNFKKQAFIQVPSLIVSGIVGITLALLGYGVWALVWMKFSQSLVISLQYWFFTGWRPTLVFNPQKFKHHFDFGYKLTLSSLLNTVVSNILPMVIGKYFSIVQVGYFNRAQSMKDLPVNGLSSALNKVTYPLFVEAKHDDAKLKNAYKKIQSLVVFVLAAIMLYLIIIAEPLFLILLGEKWLPAVPYFQLLCIIGIFYPVNAYNLNILKVKGRSDQFLKAALIKKTLYLIGIFLTYKFGIIPLILSIIVNSFISLFINIQFGKKHLKYYLFEQLKDIFYALLPALITAIITFFISINLPLSLYYKAIIVTVIYFAIFIILNIFFSSNNSKEILSLIKNIPNAKTLFK